MGERLVTSETAHSIREEESPSNITMDTQWQERLLPLMVRMTVGLTLFFIIASSIQLAFLHRAILRSPQLEIQSNLPTLPIDREHQTSADYLSASRLRALIVLESTSLDRHYHQANVLLMSRVWIHYLGFVTGMILALLGAAFILGKLREPSSEFQAKSSGIAEFSLKTASPGLILAVLGVMLMMTTIVAHHEISENHVAVYLHDSPSIDSPKIEAPPLTRSEGARSQAP
jgi:hypothetical protein